VAAVEQAARSGDAETLEVPLWRALTVFRLAALGYAALLMANNFRRYAHPYAGWAVIAVMAGWSAVTIYGYARPRWRGWPLLTADLVVTAACLLASPWVFGPAGHRIGIANVPGVWIAGPVVAWAITGGRRRGAVAAVLIGICDVLARGNGGATQVTLSGMVALLLTGIAVGHVARLAVEAERRLQRAVELEAVTRERERLARGIHDSVLQVLALVQRRGSELGGESAELGRLAGEQEAALRALIGADRTIEQPGGPVDLRTLLAPYTSTLVFLATPAQPVRLAASAAREVAAAVGAALSNVREHCGPGTRAWVLVEEETDGVRVSVRDDGPGIPPGRLAEATAAGRLGVAQSIRGRMRDLGGTATITATPGQGTEVELHVPR
jgi:signal transduction histidine kinase